MGVELMRDSLKQESYLVESRGDVQESLPESFDENGNLPEDPNARVFYMVHPSVDQDISSSLQ